MSKKNKHRIAELQHVRLYHVMLRSPAWKSLSAPAQALYVHISMRYRGHGSNNGRIPLSVRQAALALHVGIKAAWLAFRQLQDRGFIEETDKGGFSRKARHCTLWRLTEFPCDVTDQLASKKYQHWKPEVIDLEAERKSRKM